MRQRPKRIHKKLPKIRVIEIEKKSKLNSLQRFQKLIRRPIFIYSWSIICTLIMLIGFLNDWSGVKEKYLQTPEETYREKNFISGIHVPADVISKYESLYLLFGYFQCEIPMADLKKGMPIRPQCFLFNDSSAFNLSVVYKGGELFFSTTFHNFEGQYLGQMDYNQWHLKSDKIAYYPSETDDYLEVFDDRNNIMFQMRYLQQNRIQFQGYYIADNGTLNIFVGNEYHIVSNIVSEMLAAQTDLKRIQPLGENHFH